MTEEQKKEEKKEPEQVEKKSKSIWVKAIVIIMFVLLMFILAISKVLVWWLALLLTVLGGLIVFAISVYVNWQTKNVLTVEEIIYNDPYQIDEWALDYLYVTMGIDVDKEKAKGILIAPSKVGESQTKVYVVQITPKESADIFTLIIDAEKNTLHQNLESYKVKEENYTIKNDKYFEEIKKLRFSKLRNATKAERMNVIMNHAMKKEKFDESIVRNIDMATGRMIEMESKKPMQEQKEEKDDPTKGGI